MTLGRLEAQDAMRWQRLTRRVSGPPHLAATRRNWYPWNPTGRWGAAQEGKRCPAPDSDSEELVPVAPDQEMGTDQEGKRCPAPDSGSEELVPAAPNQDVRTRPGEAKASNSPALGSSASHTSASAASQPRPWTRKDTDLSKALSRVLRHRSNLQLDEAGYAKLADVLFHPLIRDLKPTMDWIVYIVKANAKQRFSLNEAGTHIRAVQGHSIPVDSSKLLRQLESGDIGDMVPTCALHSTYFSCVPSIMQHGLLPGGTRGTSYRRHVHLAMSHRPAAGLRAGSDVILVIDLMRAHNAGCVFYVSDNNVILTEDCIPPPCITRAKCTSTGEAYDLSQFRAAYKIVYAASNLSAVVILGLGPSTTWSVIKAKFAPSPCCRCSSRAALEPPGLSGLAGSRQLSTRVRQTSSSGRIVDKAAAPTSIPAVPGRGAWPLRTLDQLLNLLAAYRLPLASAVNLLHSFSRLRIAMQKGTPLGHERRYSWKATAGRSEASSPPTLDHRDHSAPSIDDQSDFAGDKEPGVQTEDVPVKPMKRPRPSVAPRLRAGNAEAGSVYRDNAALSLGPQVLSTAGNGQGSMAKPTQETWRSAYYEEEDMEAGSPEASNVDSLSGRSDADSSVHKEADWSAGTSPPWPEHHTRTSVSPGHDPDPEGPESPAARRGVTDEEDIDFHFGMRAGDPQPTARASVDVDLTRAPARPKAAAKMLVRSGLRCPKCLLKTWVCLCNRAPRELDRRGTAPRPYERYWLFCLPCRHLVVPFRPRAVCCWHPAHSGSAGVRHHRWLAAITVRSAVVSPKPLYPRTSPPEVPCHHSITWQLFMRYSYCKTPPSPRRAKLQPNRGPKSVPEPYFGRPTPLATYRLRGVRVSPLSAGGEGLCKARSRLLNGPGKLAEGIQQQLGLFSCHCSTCSGHYLLHTLSRSVPWGNRFRLWKFKYRVVRFKKKRSRKWNCIWLT